MSCNQSDVIRTGSNVQWDRLKHHWICTWAGQLLQLVSRRTQVLLEFSVPAGCALSILQHIRSSTKRPVKTSMNIPIIAVRRTQGHQRQVQGLSLAVLGLACGARQIPWFRHNISYVRASPASLTPDVSLHTRLVPSISCNSSTTCKGSWTQYQINCSRLNWAFSLTRTPSRVLQQL